MVVLDMGKTSKMSIQQPIQRYLRHLLIEMIWRIERAAIRANIWVSKKGLRAPSLEDFGLYYGWEQVANRKPQWQLELNQQVPDEQLESIFHDELFRVMEPKDAKVKEAIRALSNHEQPPWVNNTNLHMEFDLDVDNKKALLQRIKMRVVHSQVYINFHFDIK